MKPPLESFYPASESTPGTPIRPLRPSPFHGPLPPPPFRDPMDWTYNATCGHCWTEWTGKVKDCVEGTGLIPPLCPRCGVRIQQDLSRITFDMEHKSPTIDVPVPPLPKTA